MADMQSPVIQSIFSLRESWVSDLISLLVHINYKLKSAYIFHRQKVGSFCIAKAPHIFWQNWQYFCQTYVLKCNILLANGILSFEPILTHSTMQQNLQQSLWVMATWQCLVHCTRHCQVAITHRLCCNCCCSLCLFTWAEFTCQSMKAWHMHGFLKDIAITIYKLALKETLLSWQSNPVYSNAIIPCKIISWRQIAMSFH